MQDGVRALVGALVLAALSTFGDWVWAEFIPQDKGIHGVVHGAVIFAAIGAVLGWAAGSTDALRRAVLGQIALGVVVSASFYPLYHLVGIASLFLTWMALWLGTAWLQRWVRDQDETARRALIRGLVAAVASGLAFYAISGIWTRPDPEGPNYVWHFLCWAFAFLPGFLALFLGSPRRLDP
ncbi:MAG: hypothetical protein AAGD06_15440 [Acidobacteriota bacterium]